MDINVIMQNWYWKKEAQCNAIHFVTNRTTEISQLNQGPFFFHHLKSLHNISDSGGWNFINALHADKGLYVI